jgi:threonine aldolase
MGNQVSIKTHTQPGDEIIVERNAHIFNYECGSPGMLSGVQVFPIEGHHGVITAEQIARAVRPDNIHHPTTRLICLENTHNRAGGTIFPIDEIQRIHQFAREAGLRMHLDGARLWNASVATGIPLKEYCQYFDSVQLCFSKGLGAPVGSIIVSSAEFIERARYFRKAFGGGMRQAGILAAGAIYAVQHHFDRLAEDHRRARRLAEAIAELPDVSIDLDTVQTNIVIFDMARAALSAEELVKRLQQENILMIHFGASKIRAVTHLHIHDDDIERTISTMRAILS